MGAMLFATRQTATRTNSQGIAPMGRSCECGWPWP